MDLDLELQIMSTQIERFTNDLLLWFTSNKRIYPWRYSTNPYPILLAEMLLLQTNAGKAVKAYTEILSLYQDIFSLANADLTILEQIIKPLGFKYRARVLIDVAEQIVNKYGGDIPATEEKLLAIKGIGKYTSSAVLCFGFGKIIPIVDTNVVRIINRIFCIDKSNNNYISKYMYSFAEQLLDKTYCKEYNWAIIDFGALVCKTNKPRCLNCPFNDFCLSMIETK